MRFTSITLAALSLSVGLGVCAAGCNERRADSAYHPSPAAWYGYNPSTVDGSHAAKPTNIAPQVPGDLTETITPGTTRATAGVGGIGGGPTDGTAPKGEHKGHFGAVSGKTDDGTIAVSRTGKK